MAVRGLGLTISQSLCELMEGHIEVDSKVGGSKFSFEIDLEVSDSNPSAEVEQSLNGKNALFFVKMIFNLKFSKIT